MMLTSCDFAGSVHSVMSFVSAAADQAPKAVVTL
jgi:hypothetical protein